MTVIGLTLVVAPDVAGGFLLLFAAIIFHQVFEGSALGTKTASLPTSTPLLKKCLLASIFALVTLIGMAIGIAGCIVSMEMIRVLLLRLGLWMLLLRGFWRGLVLWRCGLLIGFLGG